MSNCALRRIWKWIANLYRVGLITAPEFADALVHRVFFVMQAYLTNGWRVSFTYAAGVMNFWEGIGLVLPSLFQFLADTLFGNFTVAVITSIFSSVGIGMVALSVPHILDRNGGRCLKTKAESCLSETETAVFYTGMVLTALGRAGISFSLDALRDDANAHADGGEQSSRGSCRFLHDAIKNYLEFVRTIDKFFIYLIGSLLIMIWIQKWKLLFGIPAIYSAYMTLMFVCGSCCYPRPRPRGSPLTGVLRVIYAAVKSTNQSQPLIRNQNDHTYNMSYGVGFTRCLNKTLHREGQDPDNKRTFDKETVEVARFIVGMIPVSCTFIFCGIVSSIGNTYFVEQANHMNRRLGKWNAPLLALQLPVLCFKLFHDIYLKILFKLDHCLKLKSDLPIAGIILAMLYSVLCCITAALMEMKRLTVVKNHGLIDKPDSEEVPMHAAWLLLQFFLLAGLDSCLRKSIEEFYKAQAPQHLRTKLEGDDKSIQRYLKTAVDFVCGLGFWYSVLSVYVVGKVSEIGGNDNWFHYTLNKSRLDRYYWVLAGLSLVNLVVFILVVRLGCVRRLSESEEIECCS